MTFSETGAAVGSQGHPPESFLSELVSWARSAAEEIFASNDEPRDVYAFARPRLGTPTIIGGNTVCVWESPLHRRAAMCEVMRVHAGFESSWKWSEGVDVGNQHSVSHIQGQETGIFQVSFDSSALHHSAMLSFLQAHGIDTPLTFIPAMKADPDSGPTEQYPERPVTHRLALEYYARLVRVSIAWAGPLIRNGNGARDDVGPRLSRAACDEFQTLLS